MKEAQKIISRYEIQCHQSGYIFPILNQKRHITPMQKFNRVRKVIKYINRELHTIAKELNLNGDVTTYVARHTFATVLRKSGVDIGIISQSLGHQDIQTTQIYLDSFDNAQVDSTWVYSLFLLRSNSFNLKEYNYTSPNSFTSDFDSAFTSSNNSVRVLKYGSFA